MRGLENDAVALTRLGDREEPVSHAWEEAAWKAYIRSKLLNGS